VNSNENPVTGGAISPDGKYLVYTDFNGMHVKPLEGGDVVKLPDPDVYEQNRPKWEIGHWLPDSAHFFAIAEFPQKASALWVLSAAGGAARHLVDGAAPWGVSPDGSLVALTENDDHEIWAAETSGAKQTLILKAGDASRFRAVRWSPDGGRLVYIRNVMVDGRNESRIEALDRKSGATRELAGGRALQTVSELEEGLQDLIWLSAERVIFVGGVPDIQGVSCNLWEMRLDPNTAEPVSGPEQITNWAGFCVTTLSNTADGKKLVFTRSSDLITVFVADFDSAKRTIRPPGRITFTEGLSSTLAWSNDGKILYLMSNRDGKWGIFKQELGSSSARAVFERDDGIVNPTLTPDNQWILYQTHDSAEPGDVNHLMRVAVAGGAEQEVLQGRNFRVACGHSPRGLCVIAEATVDYGRLVFAKLDPFRGKGQELARVQTPRAEGLVWALSPDGMEVAIAEEFATEFEILSFRDSQLRRVPVLGDAHLRTITWSARGEGLLVSSAIREGAQLLAVDRTGKSTKLWELDGWNTYLQAVASPDGKRLAIDGSAKSSNVWALEDF
jgi:Tol biopolymer transport system component